VIYVVREKDSLAVRCQYVTSRGQYRQAAKGTRL